MKTELSIQLSIVIPAFNEEKLLRECLESIRLAAESIKSASWRWEMIVCDNNSSDRTAEIAREAGARVVFEEVNQIGRARNRGASIARGQWVLFVDADSTVPPIVFQDLKEQIETGKVIGGGACIAAEDELAHRLRFPLAVWNTISRVTHWAAGSFLFCRRDIFEQVGGFSLERYAGEELDLSRRIKKVAKSLKLRFIILKKGKILTSSRKCGLYSNWELLTTFLGVALRYRKATGNREACFLWYDGRR